MATLTATIEEVQQLYNANRVRVTVYVTGETSGGDCHITIRKWDKAAIYDGTVQVVAQSGGTNQVYTGLHNVACRYPNSRSGGCICAVEASMDGASDLFKIQSLTSDGIAPYGTSAEFGETIYYAVGANIGSGKYELNFVGEALPQRNVTIFSGAKQKGIYQYTIPLDLMSYIPTQDKVTGRTDPNEGNNISAYRNAAQLNYDVTIQYPTSGNQALTISVPESYVPTLGDIRYSDANSCGAPGDGIIDAFVQRLSSVQAWATAEATGYARICKVMCTYGTLSASMGAIQGPAITMPTASSPLVLGTINETGDLTMTLTVEDSRKRRTTKTVTLKTAAYDYPTVSSIDIERWDTTENHSDDESTTVRVHVVGTFTDVNGKGNIGYIKVYADEAVASPDFQLKSTTELEAPAFDKSIDHTGFAETQAWRFKWEVADRFGQMLSGEVLIYGARPTIDVSPDGQSIGFWTTAGGREDMEGNPVNGFYLNGDLTLQEGRAIYGTGGEQENRMDVDKILEFAYNYSTQKFQLDALQNIALSNDRYLAGYNAAGSLIRLLGVNTSGQVELNWTSGGLSGRVLKRLWSGTLSEGGSVTVPELPYYNIFAIVTGGCIGIGVRHFMNNPAYISVAPRSYGAKDSTDSENYSALWLVFSGTTAKLEHSRLFNPITNAYINGNPSVSAIYGVL